MSTIIKELQTKTKTSTTKDSLDNSCVQARTRDSQSQSGSSYVSLQSMYQKEIQNLLYNYNLLRKTEETLIKVHEIQFVDLLRYIKQILF